MHSQLLPEAQRVIVENPKFSPINDHGKDGDADSMTSPAEKTFAVPELGAKILAFLPAVEILSVLRVSHAFEDAISGCPSIRQLLFLRPDDRILTLGDGKPAQRANKTIRPLADKANRFDPGSSETHQQAGTPESIPLRSPAAVRCTTDSRIAAESGQTHPG
ncbi:hypothetical protein TI39_contig426g00012 [Zymoseptoria brevis]|uniref:F-box domain-containing protein n=1 Tax=Zymoseptoria brevis TaxID=1047168 RepID=A0A0F4GLC1_9PEZI|nr:hypothetical protein TI39_contig426g00012 [Zymoseptoria brevis]